MEQSQQKQKQPPAYDLKAVHQANLRILKEIDRICRSHGIRYFADSGTLLGAVRHKGFIPWDDDADVAFTRENYEAFARVVRDELPEGMEFLEPSQIGDGKAFFDFTPRILYLNSRTHEDSREMAFYGGKLNHIWVDLFILDKLPASPAGAAVTRFVHKAIYGLAMGHRPGLDFKKYSLIHKIFVGGLAGVGRFIPLRLISAMQRAAALKDRRSRGTRWYYSNYQPDYLYVTLEGSWCEAVEDAAFEDAQLMIPKGWHEVLTEVYGDYMKLPPVEKRVPTHSSQQIEVWDDEAGEARA